MFPFSRSAAAYSKSSRTNGDTHLGGEDFDNLFLHFLIKHFKKESGIDLTNDRLAVQRCAKPQRRPRSELFINSDDGY